MKKQVPLWQHTVGRIKNTGGLLPAEVRKVMLMVYRLVVDTLAFKMHANISFLNDKKKMNNKNI